MTKPKTYTSREVVETVGCTYRMLDHWCRRGLIPGQEEAPGSGHRRTWTHKQMQRAALLYVASQRRGRNMREALDAMLETA